MTAALATLNPAALVTLADCELRIERGLKTFIDVGQALAEIRDSRLYKGTHGTFEDYCAERWNMSRPRAYELISAAEVVSGMPDTAPPVTNARQAAALAAVPEPERAEVWRETVERTNGKPTAAAVRAVQTERTKTPGPVDVIATPPADPGPDRHLRAVPEPVRSEPAEKLRDDLLRESERRTAIASIRSVLTYLTSRVLDPAAVASQYAVALVEFDAKDLRFAAETMAAIAALKEQ